MSAKPKPPNFIPEKADTLSVLAYNIRSLRVARGWSQETLAFECGLDRTYVSAVERSRWNIAIGNIDKLAKALGVGAWELLLPPEIQA